MISTERGERPPSSFCSSTDWIWSAFSLSSLTAPMVGFRCSLTTCSCRCQVRSLTEPLTASSHPSR